MESSDWLELREGKQWSRLLYPNPVCFLCTTTTSTCSSNYSTIGDEEVRYNVMVLSWLTATNNHGRVMFSMNRRRYTASRLSQRHFSFVLCVPVQGMEELVRQVGSASGRLGSKFPRDVAVSQPTTTKNTTTLEDSNNQKKKKTQAPNEKGAPRFPHGIPGLQRVSVVGNSGSDLFAIQGTVAHLVCRLDRWILDDDMIDQEHGLGLAQVTTAFVRPDYWNPQKNIFGPKHDNAPPYLTFLGSQTFGHVVMATEDEKTK